MKTVRQIAEAIQVNRVTVYKAIKDEKFQKHITKQDNVTYIDFDGEQLLFEMFKDNSKRNSINNSKPTVAETEEILFLREQNQQLSKQLSKTTDEMFAQIKEKDKQIETILNQLSEKNTQIETAHRLIENSQILLREQNLKSLPEPTPEKVGFWKRVFKKKNGQ